MIKPIIVHAIKSKTKYIRNEKYYALKPKGKMVWLQKLCFWTLGKLKAQALLPHDYVERVVIEPLKVMDNIMAQKINLLNLGYPSKLEIFIGPEMMDTFVMDNMDYITFTAPIGVNKEIMGMDVTVVPWMEGVLVVPKDRKRVN